MPQRCLPERRNPYMKDKSYAQLLADYEDALGTIADQEMELRELKQELDDYIQAFEELQYEIG